MKPLGPRLRHRVAFFAFIKTRDGNGDEIQDWFPLAGLDAEPAEVLTGAGPEAVRSGQPTSAVAARITVRWRSELASPYGLRVTHGPDLYQVESHYTDATDRRWLTLVCTKGLLT